MANHLALELDRSGVAEMSCTAGVGGGVAPLVRLARSGRPVIAIDGCRLACARQCLIQQGVEPDQHVLLNTLGVRKRLHADFDHVQADELLGQLSAQAVQLGPSPPRPAAPGHDGQAARIILSTGEPE